MNWKEIIKKAGFYWGIGRNYFIVCLVTTLDNDALVKGKLKFFDNMDGHFDFSYKFHEEKPILPDILSTGWNHSRKFKRIQYHFIETEKKIIEKANDIILFYQPDRILGGYMIMLNIAINQPAKSQYICNISMKIRKQRRYMGNN